MSVQVKEHGQVNVLTNIRVSVEKCAMGLGISMSTTQVETLCLDILEVYKWDSVEDVQQCLKKARQGKYGFGHHSRSALTMILVGDWMAVHLEEKAMLRENEAAANLPQPEIFKSQEEVDAWYKRGQEFLKELDRRKQALKDERLQEKKAHDTNEINYQDFKENHFNNQSNPNPSGPLQEVNTTSKGVTVSPRALESDNSKSGGGSQKVRRGFKEVGEGEKTV
jgi:hypothetical protein